MVHCEALALAFDDVFLLMACLFIGALVIVPFCRKPVPVAASAEVH